LRSSTGVVYVKVAGQSRAISGSRVWAVVPTCSEGACSLHVRSRPVGTKAGYPLPFDFDGTTYQNVQNAASGGPCVRPDGSVVVANGYSAAILIRFRATRMSTSGRALTFKGTVSERYTVNAAGRAQGCGAYYTSTESYTGYAVTQ
jgi:hypothetical protein